MNICPLLANRGLELSYKPVPRYILGFKTPDMLDFEIQQMTSRGDAIRRVSPYSTLADKLIQKRLMPKEKTVKIDYLAFSFPLAELRHCHKAGVAGYTSKTQTRYPLPPKVESYVASNDEEFEKYKSHVQEQLADFYIETLRVFVDRVLGLELSAPRGKGFNGYKESMNLCTRDGKSVGFIALGGNRNTVYFDIAGQGCQHIFSHTTTFVLHHWLNTVLSMTQLSRIDLAKDDYDDNFNCDYAHDAFKDGWFRTGKGGRMPELGCHHRFNYDDKMTPIYSAEMWSVGMRGNPIYWRIYNKKLEQDIKDGDFTWYRSEVELRKWTVDALLDVDLAFAGINGFAQSMVNKRGVRTKSMTKAKEAAVDIAARVKWFRRSCGKALSDILSFYDGDIETALGVILPDDSGGKLGIPPTYKRLINFAMEH